MFDFNIKMWKKIFVPFFEAKVGGATYTRINTVNCFKDIVLKIEAVCAR